MFSCIPQNNRHIENISINPENTFPEKAQKARAENVGLLERRHKLYKHEIHEVVKGLVLRLRQHLENREDRENAETAFRALFRLINAEPGRPNYWEFAWENVQIYLERYVPEDYIP